MLWHYRLTSRVTLSLYIIYSRRTWSTSGCCTAYGIRSPFLFAYNDLFNLLISSFMYYFQNMDMSIRVERVNMKREISRMPVHLKSTASQTPSTSFLLYICTDIVCHVHNIPPYPLFPTLNLIYCIILSNLNSCTQPLQLCFKFLSLLLLHIFLNSGGYTLNQFLSLLQSQ